MKAVYQLVLLMCIEGFVAQHLVRAGPVSNILHEIRTDIKADVKEILGKLHHIPAPDTDQCALSRLGLSALFGQRQPYNLKSTSCQIQGAVSSNPIGCKKINGGNHTATAGCGINTSIGTQPAFTTSPIRNATFVGPKNFVVLPPQPPPEIQRRHLLSTEISASPLASYTNVSGSVVTYNPNNSSIDATDFYYAFTNAYSGGYTALRVVPGNYTIINTFGGFHFIAGCYGAQRSPFEIDFGGSTFVLTDGTSGGFFFNYCNNVLAHNVTMYYEFSQNPWYQATITGISANGQIWNITVQDGYPIDYVTDYYQALCVPWDPATRLPLQNTSDIYPTPGATISLGGTNFQFSFNYVNFGISVGDYITCRGNQGNHGLINWYSQNMTLKDITFYNPAVYGIYEETGNNNTYINNKFIPYPYPVGNGGAQQAPLQSSTADGFHASTSFIGPNLINNTFLNNGDDGIAIHGRYYLVVAADPVGGNITVATGCTYPCSRLYQGTGLTAYTNSTESLGSTTILGITLIPDPLPPNSVSITLPGTNLNTGTQYLNITVACWPANFSRLVFDGLITSRSDEGDGFQVVGNQIGYNRGRGILLKASNGIVTGNSFIKPKFIAAQITPEVYWQEADFASNIIVSNNIFDSYYSGIVLGIFLDGSYNPGHFQNHINVTISGNIIRSAADQPLLVTSSTNVTVANNLFDSVLCYPYAYGAAQSFIPLPQPPIFIAYASNVRVVNNTYSIPANCTYGNFSSPIQTLPGTVTGLSLS